MKKRMVFAMAIIFLWFVSGCASSEEVYDEFTFFESPTRIEWEAIGQGNMALSYDEGDFDNYFDYIRYRIGNTLDVVSSMTKNYAGLIIACSISLGVLMLCIARKSIQIRKFAFFVFILGIPLMVMFLVYGTAIIADLF